ncbi:MAG: ATP-dependent zinc metalloprotease FtsH [Desulfuromonadaceae bacterium]|nr:ATP-dependent zinc metalloprotease FtsH [Desulfuromonadaceae bacterium]
MKSSWNRVVLFMLAIIALNAGFVYLFPSTSQEPQALISYSRFKQILSTGQIAEVTLENKRVNGRFKDAVTLEQPSASKPLLSGTEGDGQGELREYVRFKTILPPVEDPTLLPLLEEHGVQIEANIVEDTPLWAKILLNLLPWVLIVGVWWFFIARMRRQGGMGGSVMGKVGQSGAERYVNEQTGVTFADVAGLKEEKNELSDIINYLRDPQRFTRVGGRVPRGVLLAGPPGTGKTYLARAVAGEAGVPFFSISASQFIEMFVGVGASRVRDLFKNAKKNAPSIIFVDELDAVGRARGTGLGGGNDEREQTLNQLLSELDGFTPNDEVIVLAATNRPDVLDTALLRAGRFDRQVIIGRPDWRDRAEILLVHTRNIPTEDDIDFEAIAKGTPGMVGADLANLCNEAALIAGREDCERVSNSHFERAKDRQLMGMERKLFLSVDERHLTAVHEGGHALVARLIPGSDPVHKITIIPHGQALGLTQQLPDDDVYYYQRSYLMGRMCVMLGGRMAEKEIFGEYSTGAQNDLKQVMDLAEKMVCQWGMSNVLGALSYPRGEEHPFLGRKLAAEKNFSDKTAWIIDQEVRNLVTQAEKCAGAIIAGNRTVLSELADLLVAEETLDRAAFEAFMAEKELTKPDGACAEAMPVAATKDEA